MKYLLIISIIFMTAGCAAKKENARADAYQASLPSCSAHNDEIDCQWKEVPASWHRIVERYPWHISPQFLGDDLVRPALFASLSTAASIYVAAPLTGSLCRIPRAAIGWLLHSSTGIRVNNPYHTQHIRDTAVKCLAERARQFAL